MEFPMGMTTAMELVRTGLERRGIRPAALAVRSLMDLESEGACSALGEFRGVPVVEANWVPEGSAGGIVLDYSCADVESAVERLLEDCPSAIGVGSMGQLAFDVAVPVVQVAGLGPDQAAGIYLPGAFA